ncbi:hypothetical protein AX14_000949 [Amanita brunnescens Koide BX004]|nr:hypothetical protein AX14_000949 [Amanita brunnescens Koide BX004]
MALRFMPGFIYAYRIPSQFLGPLWPARVAVLGLAWSWAIMAHVVPSPTTTWRSRHKHVCRYSITVLYTLLINSISGARFRPQHFVFKVPA